MIRPYYRADQFLGWTLWVDNPPLDAGCINCTQGATPDKYNTGLCAYHNAKKLLGHAT